jgi:hypothetical protein
MARLTIEDLERACDNISIESDKDKVLDMMLSVLKSLPTTTEKADVMAETTREKLENPIYTKKLKFDIEQYNGPTSRFSGMLCSFLDIEYISVSSDKEDFSNASTNDIRINCRDRYNNWVNVFADNYSCRYLSILCYLMSELVKPAPVSSNIEGLIAEMKTLAKEITAYNSDTTKIPEIVWLMKDALHKS